MNALPAIRAPSHSSSSVGRPVASGKGIKKSGKRRWNTNTSRRRGRASGRRPGMGRGVLRFEKLKMMMIKIMMMTTTARIHTG